MERNREPLKPFDPELFCKSNCRLSVVEHESDPRWVELLGEYHGFLVEKLVANDTIKEY